MMLKIAATRLNKIAASVTVALAAAPLTMAWAADETDDWVPITDERLLNPEPGDWLSYRRTYDVMGFSPLQQINRDNVAQLRPVWTYSMRDNNRWVATPIVANGLMYVAEGSGRVLAFDVPTGEVVWTYTRQFPEDISSSEGYPRARGVAIHGDTIYWGTADMHLVALDARTGAVRWDVQTGDFRTGEGHAHPPLVIDGKVFIGAAGGDLAARGKFQARDASTGELLWEFYTVPRSGEPGYETWTANGKWEPAGGAPWNTVSYDPELKLVYFSTGQPAPWSTAARGPGDSLYTNSVLAVEADTGKLRWHYQLSPADDWDRAAYESMLVDLEIGGVMRKALVTTGKIGWGVVLDRATGEFLQAFPTAYDNMITGWTESGRPIYDPKTIPQPEDMDTTKIFFICPHLHGARNLQAPSFSPVTGYYYLGVNNACMNAQVVTPVFDRLRGLTGVTFTTAFAPGYDFVGEFVAFDPVTGKRAWEYRPPSGAPMTASALATAGGIVFGGTADRQFFALDSENGKLLWQMRLNGDVSGAPVTFEHDGVQYVAVTAGGRAAPTLTLGRLVDVDVPQGTGVVWVFALPGDQPMEVPRRKRPDAPTRSTLEGVYTAEQAARGEEVFNRECSGCHLASAYTGANFGAKWSGMTLGDIYQHMSLAMPPSNPGGLAPQAYASIIAFFLSRSANPEGEQELPADAAILRTIAVP
jgi:alcohol dehydrogenase (cytochrome c)